MEPLSTLELLKASNPSPDEILINPPNLISLSSPYPFTRLHSSYTIKAPPAFPLAIFSLFPHGVPHAPSPYFRRFATAPCGRRCAPRSIARPIEWTISTSSLPSTGRGAPNASAACGSCEVGRLVLGSDGVEGGVWEDGVGARWSGWCLTVGKGETLTFQRPI